MKKLNSILAILLSIAVAACSGGGGDSGTPTGEGGNISGKVTLSGTVASGLPFANQPVSIRDKNGNTASATTSADGTYSAELNNMTAPYLIKVGSLYSVATATASGTANVHPFTDMIVRNWYKVKNSDADTAFTAPGAMPTPPTATEIDTIEATVRQILATYMKGADVNPSNFNLITTPFNANHSGFDLVLDNVKVTQPTAPGGDVTIELAGGGTTPTPILTIPEATDLTTITPPPVPVSDIEAPTAPGAITASKISGTTQVVLSWVAATDNIQVAGYKVYLNGTQFGITDQPFYIDGAAPDTQACYTVAAYDAAGNSSGQNTEVCATLTVAADVTPPAAPGNLTAVASSSSQIDLAWSASTDDVAVAGYRVMVGGAAIATLAADATTYSHTGLSANTQYSYTVVAVDTSGNATSSNLATATTGVQTDTTAPTAPSGLTATAISDTRIDLAWTASADVVGVAGYNVYSGATLVGTSATASYSAVNLTASTQYCYTVKAYDAAGNVSVASAEACQTTATTGGSGTPPPSTAGISATFTAFQNLYATALPSATDPNLTSLFASTFLEDGMNFAQWLPNSGFTTEPILIGFQVSNLQVVSVDATGTVAQVQFKVFSATGVDLTASNPAGVVSWQMKLNAANGAWQIDGNQKIIQVNLRSFAAHSTCGVQALQCNPATTPDSYATGLTFEFGQTSSQPIGTILVTGPGLPLNGISMVPGMNGWSISTANTAGCVVDATWPWEWCMTDAEILNASAGSTYTFKFYDTSASPVLLATDTAMLAAAPKLNTALTALAYPTLTNLPDISAGITAATLTPTWTIPTGQIGGGIGAYIWQSPSGISANTAWYGLWNTPAGSGTASIVVPAPVSGTWNSAVWDTTSTDLTGSNLFRTHYR